MDVQLAKVFGAEAAHTNEKGLHGHSYRITVIAEGVVDAAFGWLVDYADIKRAFRPLLDQLDHHHLNDIEAMGNARLGDVQRWITERLGPALPCFKAVHVAIAGDCAFRPVVLLREPGLDLPARLRFTFEAAQSLPHLAEGHPCRRLHGHTYRIEIGAADPARLIEPARQIYNTLDHTYLNHTPGLEAATSERLCQWIWNRLAGEAQGVEAVIVQETETARCIYHGE